MIRSRCSSEYYIRHRETSFPPSTENRCGTVGFPAYKSFTSSCTVYAEEARRAIHLPSSHPGEFSTADIAFEAAPRREAQLEGLSGFEVGAMADCVFDGLSE